MNRYVRAVGQVMVVAASVGAGWFGRDAMPTPPPMVFTARSATPAPCLPSARELPLESEPNPAPLPPRRGPRARPPSASDGVRHVRVSDETAAWVPEGGKERYTIIESSTIAENVGLLPLGTAAAHPDWTFDVVALIEAEREGHPVCPPGTCTTPKDVPEAAFLAVSHPR